MSQLEIMMLILFHLGIYQNFQKEDLMWKLLVTIQ